MTLLETIDLTKCYPAEGRLFFKKGKDVRAVDGVSLKLGKGETLGLVGESGCGKSTLGRLVLGLERATAGRILIKGQDITHAGFQQLRILRRNMQIIFQNSYSSFNPFYTVAGIIGEPLANYERLTRAERLDRIYQIMEMVGLGTEYAGRYPHQLSGGQRQRVGIARALVLNPDLVVCDEPTSSLDCSIRRQILELLKGLKEQFGLTYLFISHDLSTIKRICDRVAVMYMGRLVEVAGAEKLAQNAFHPYTRALLSASPVRDPELRKTKRLLIKGELSTAGVGRGCLFHARCHRAGRICCEIEPALEDIGQMHSVACHFKENAGDDMAAMHDFERKGA